MDAILRRLRRSRQARRRARAERIESQRRAREEASRAEEERRATRERTAERTRAWQARKARDAALGLHRDPDAPLHEEVNRIASLAKRRAWASESSRNSWGVDALERFLVGYSDDEAALDASISTVRMLVERAGFFPSPAALVGFDEAFGTGLQARHRRYLLTLEGAGGRAGRRRLEVVLSLRGRRLDQIEHVLAPLATLGECQVPGRRNRSTRAV